MHSFGACPGVGAGDRTGHRYPLSALADATERSARARPGGPARRADSRAIHAVTSHSPHTCRQIVAVPAEPWRTLCPSRRPASTEITGPPAHRRTSPIGHRSCCDTTCARRSARTSMSHRSCSPRIQSPTHTPFCLYDDDASATVACKRTRAHNACMRTIRRPPVPTTVLRLTRS